MAWQDQLVPMLRDMLGDNVAPLKFTDEDLEGVLITGARLVSKEVGFVNEYVIDRENISILPDPTLEATLDPDFSNLMTVRAACIITKGQMIKTSGQAIKIVDNKSQIDLKDTFRARQAVVEQTWCKQYQIDLLNYKKRVGGSGGGNSRQVISPYGRI